MQYPTQKFRQSSLVFKKAGVFVWKIETFDELQLPETLVTLVEILHMFSTY